jgi:hypothetical protein
MNQRNSRLIKKALIFVPIILVEVFAGWHGAMWAFSLVSLLEYWSDGERITRAFVTG